MRTVYDVKETFQARSAQEVLALLAAHPGAVLVAGGTDVMIRLKKRKLQDAVLIGLQQVPELQGVDLEADGTLSIGAGCTFDTLERHPLLQERVPMLAEACHQVGSPQIRVVYEDENILLQEAREVFPSTLAAKENLCIAL